MVHKIAAAEYLSKHKNPGAIEYYLCGPPAMVSACLEMLQEFTVPEVNISYDEF